jgi:hypothetical protein
MAAAETDYFTKVGSPGTATTLSAPGHTIGGTSITVISTTNWPTTTGAIFAMDTFTLVNGVEVRDVGSYTEWEGIVASSTSITNMVLRYGTDQNYAAGTTTRVYIPVSSSRENRLIDGMLVEHDQDGTHSNITATSITATTGTFTNFTINGTSGADGWSPLGQSLTSITALGNRSYTAVVSGVDTTGVTCVGQRLKLPRTVTAPTQCTDLEASSSQYFSRASGSLTGISFTDDYTCMAWVKIESYASAVMAIISRYNAANGFLFYVNASGQLILQNGTGTRLNTSYQSVPLNKWVHVAATMNASAGTGEVYIDGVLVPSLISGAGTSITQAGNLEIGSANAGNFFDGKIAQVGLFDAVISAATIRSYMSQTLSGSETNCIGAWTLNGVLTDSDSNANNLTAQGSAVATNADTPFTNPVTGTNITAGSTNYGIIMAQSFSTNTTYTIQIPEGETLPTTGGIGTVSYSTQKTPYGFPGDESKWEVGLYLLSTVASSGTVTSTIYNPGGLNINVPVGSWNTDFESAFSVTTAGGGIDLSTTLSTSSTAATGATTNFSSRILIGIASTAASRFSHSRSGDITVTTATPYYLLIVSNANFSTLAFEGTVSSLLNTMTQVVLRNSYL